MKCGKTGNTINAPYDGPVTQLTVVSTEPAMRRSLLTTPQPGWAISYRRMARPVRTASPSAVSH